MARRLHTLAAVTACVISFGATSAFAGVSTYDFASVSGDTTPATIGIATFSSTADPGTYTFGPNGGMLFSTLGSTILADTTGITAHELTITFAAPQNLVSFDFGLVDFFGLNGDDVLDVALNDGTPVQFDATIPGTDFFPQGTVTLSSATPITSVEITSDNPANQLVIGNLTSVPEPASMALLGAGLTGLLAVRRRRAC